MDSKKLKFEERAKAVLDDMYPKGDRGRGKALVFFAHLMLLARHIYKDNQKP